MVTWGCRARALGGVFLSMGSGLRAPRPGLASSSSSYSRAGPTSLMTAQRLVPWGPWSLASARTVTSTQSSTRRRDERASPLRDPQIRRVTSPSPPWCRNFHGHARPSGGSMRVPRVRMAAGGAGPPPCGIGNGMAQVAFVRLSAKHRRRSPCICPPDQEASVNGAGAGGGRDACWCCRYTVLTVNMALLWRFIIHVYKYPYSTVRSAS
mmetsp:Transcript_673/g.1842  ORF Transcript_673/g.1842 Transcript_673/m.1842 type:complete len:209 (-) Transcript_673:1480-2106(-)